MEQEVLELWLDFGLPQKSSREEILAEFELLHQTLIKYRQISEEEADTCRARLVDIAETTYRTAPPPPQKKKQVFSRETTLANNQSTENNKDLVITRPDKGKGVVIMKKSDYIAKMNDVLNDKSKFIRLGPVSEMDHTAHAETSMQNLLRSLHKKKNLMMPPMRK